MNGAELIVDTLIKNGVKYVFQLPGGKSGPILMALKDREKEINVVTARHEQNAGFMAQGIGRLTGKPGVVLTTAGPGALNITTALATATSDGDPVIAISGQVAQNQLYTPTPQNPNIASVMNDSTVTKYSKELEHVDVLSDEIGNAFVTSINGHPGAVFMSIPINILLSNTDKVGTDFSNIVKQINTSVSSSQNFINAQKLIMESKKPVIVIGARAANEVSSQAINKLVKTTHMPVVETSEATGTLGLEFQENYVGRLGFFNNTSANKLIVDSDLVISIGLDVVEYSNVDKKNTDKLIDIDSFLDHIDEYYLPDVFISGNIALNVELLTGYLNRFSLNKNWQNKIKILQKKWDSEKQLPDVINDKAIHPLEIIDSLQNIIDKNPDTTVVTDGGSHEVWIGGYLNVPKPNHYLASNGQQTLGVGLPWAISAALLRPDEKILSSAGDGSFMFSSQELSTVKHYNLNILQIIWVDKEYNMVEFQQELDYNGKSEGVDIDYINYKELSESFGIKAKRVHTKKQLDDALKEAYSFNGPMVIEIIEDNRDNNKLRLNK
ncbi:acetolactate synthase AlsS [Lactococcus lactis]|uniref:acetolactate synthase AlsS n=1 Tax=Lactococcus lactis TaxID=1358 RepID=UPI003877D449